MNVLGRLFVGPLLAGLLAVAITGVGGARAQPEDCPTPPEMTDVDVKLPLVAERLRTHQPLNVVAIGGASTMGKAAGSPDLSYPHRLGEDLATAFPQSRVTVANKGIPRQTAKDMFQRFGTDVFPADPALVIWEVGIYDAVQGTDVEDFAGTLRDGLDALKNRAIDIMFVDMQFSPNSATVINFDAYLKTLHRVGELADIYVFPRFEMMRYWSEQNVFNFDDVAAADRPKLAARVYDCLGRKMAEIIRRTAP